MKIFDEVFIALKNWRIDGDINGDVTESNKSDNIFDENKNKPNDESKNKKLDSSSYLEGQDNIDDVVENMNEEKDDEPVENKNVQFFEKIAILQLLSSRKNEIAKKIVDDSYADKLYWIQFTLSCMIASLGLLMNSIPVVIGAMLISPIMNPIKTFAFAITTGNKHMYLRSIKTLVISMFVAVLASLFISFIVPFSTLTTEVMSRISPTIVDLFVALFSGAVAFLSLGYKRLEENVAGVAMSVALLPPLSVIGIGVFFMDFGVAQGSFLLFMANLVAILIIGVVSFYMFGFFPTNKEGQRRSFVIGIMVLLSVLVVSIPLQQSMSQISSNMKVTNEITITSNSYLDTLDKSINVDDISFKNMSEDLLRVSTVINVPDSFIITTEHKNELTRLLSMATQKSVELDLDIVEISSVYVGEQKSEQDILIDNIAKIIHKTFNSVFVVDHRVLEQDSTLVFLDLYTDSSVDKEDVYDTLLEEVENVYGTGGSLVIQWQGNEGKSEKKQTEEELAIQSQFYAMFPSSILNHVTIDSLTKEVDGENHEYVYIDIDFMTPKSSLKTRNLLKGWKTVLEQYFDADVIINSKIDYFTNFEV